MRHSPILRIVLLISVMGGSQACDKLGLGKSPTQPDGPPAAGSAIVYTAVGASDANGVGSSAVCALFDTQCANGMGYVPVATRQLRAQGFTVTLLNLGIPTAVIGRDFQTLGQQYHPVAGNFIDQEMNFILPNSTLV